MSVQCEKLSKNHTFQFKVYIYIYTSKISAQGPGEMHPQKNFRALSAVGSLKWREHIRAKTFFC